MVENIEHFSRDSGTRLSPDRGTAVSFMTGKHAVASPGSGLNVPADRTASPSRAECTP
jgi:hypothetical protein